MKSRVWWAEVGGRCVQKATNSKPECSKTGGTKDWEVHILAMREPVVEAQNEAWVRTLEVQTMNLPRDVREPCILPTSYAEKRDRQTDMIEHIRWFLLGKSVKNT
jgi:hypothetical protein